VEESTAVPNGNDTHFADLIEYVVLEVHNPQREEEGDAASGYSIRIDRVRDIVDASPLAEWTNAQVRSDRKAFDEFAEKLEEAEVNKIKDCLFTQSATPAVVNKPNVSRISGRPPAHSNFKYGGITVQFKNSDTAVPTPLSSWEDMVRFDQQRMAAFSEAKGGGAGSDLVEMSSIVMAIERYGEQSEWSRNEQGQFTVRPIQAATLPVSLAGHNLVATAETGSGKTMCFATVALAAVSKTKPCPQVLIMAHNRPLLDQLCDEMEKLCTSLNNQVTCAFADRSDRGGGNYVNTTQIVIATAGQLNFMLKKGTIPTKDLKLVIADEVDDIFSQKSDGRTDGTDQIISQIIQRIERQRRRPQILFFSATIGDDALDPDDRALRNMIEHCVGRRHCVAKAQRKDVAGMTHVFIKCVDEAEKIKVLCWLLCDPVLVGSAMVFCKNKGTSAGRISVQSLIALDNDARKRLGLGEKDGILGVSLLAGVQEFTAGQEVTREQRLSMMRRFRDNKARVLIATDAVAKGIDVPNVTMVVHMEMCKHGRLPNGISWLKTQNKAIDQYRHRAGRTARSLQKGVSVSLITPDEEELAREYARILNITGEHLKVADGANKNDIKAFLQEAQI